MIAYNDDFIIKIDVVIITYDRLDMVRSCLESLSNSISNFNIQILFGFNGSSSDFIDEVKDYVRRVNLQGRVHFFYNTGQLPGAARNQILKKSFADWIFFCDDDIILPNFFFAIFFKLLKKNSTVNVFGGPNLTPEFSSPIEQAQGIALGLFTVTGPVSNRYSSSSSNNKNSIYSLTLCNLFWKRSDYLFPNDFYCGEELHLLTRTPNPFLSSAELSVFHFRRKNWSDFFRQTLKYGIGRTEQSILMLTLLFLVVCILLCLSAAVNTMLIFGYFSCILTEVCICKLKNKNKVSFFLIFTAAFIIQFGYCIGLCVGLLRRLKK